MLADDDIYVPHDSQKRVQRCTNRDSYICCGDKFKTNRMHSLDWRVQQYSCFVISSNTNSFLIISHILHSAFLLSWNGCHLFRLFSGAIHMLFTCGDNIKLSVRCISLCSNSRKSGSLVMVLDHAVNLTRLVTRAEQIMINRWTQSWPTSLFSIGYINSVLGCLRFVKVSPTFRTHAIQWYSGWKWVVTKEPKLKGGELRLL